MKQWTATVAGNDSWPHYCEWGGFNANTNNEWGGFIVCSMGVEWLLARSEFLVKLGKLFCWTRRHEKAKLSIPHAMIVWNSVLSCVLKTKFITATDTPTLGKSVTATRKAVITVLRSSIKVASNTKVLFYKETQDFLHVIKLNKINVNDNWTQYQCETLDPLIMFDIICCSQV